MIEGQGMGGQPVHSQILRHQEVRHGPIPEAEELERYERVCPGLATRIMAMAENESAARQRLSQNALEAQISNDHAGRMERRIGQICAFVLACLALTLSFVAAIYQAQLFATITGSLSIGSLCLAFVLGRRPPKAE